MKVFLPAERAEDEGGGGKGGAPAATSPPRPPPPPLDLPEPIERVPVLPVIGNISMDIVELYKEKNIWIDREREKEEKTRERE